MERATPPPLFGLASHGVYPASLITQTAVRSYRTFSPLLPAGEPAGSGTFSVALAVALRLGVSPRSLTGMLPYEDRTFLPTNPADGTHPAVA